MYAVSSLIIAVARGESMHAKVRILAGRIAITLCELWRAFLRIRTWLSMVLLSVSVLIFLPGTVARRSRIQPVSVSVCMSCPMGGRPEAYSSTIFCSRVHEEECESARLLSMRRFPS